MRYIPHCLIIASAILLASCADPQPQAGSSAELSIPAELRAIMRANREIALPPPHPDFDEIAAGFLTPGAPNDIMRQLQIASDIRQQRRQAEREVSPCDLLAHEDIAWEIDFVFDILRHAYAAYQYFGGDEVFLPLRDSMLERLAGMDNPLSVYAFLEDLLAPSFQGVIEDNHFWLSFPGGERRLFDAPAHALHMSDEFTLRRSAGDLVAEIDGEMHRVLETTLRDGQPANGILPTLTAEGEFAFAFGRFDRVGNSPVEMTAHFENIATSERHSRVVALPMVESPPQQYRLPLAKREEGGVTIMETRTFMPDVGVASDFFDAGYALRGEPVFILDLRDNRGGIGYFPVTWMYAYIG